MSTLYLVVMPIVPGLHQYYFSQQAQTYATYEIPLLGHIVFGSIALILGALNLVSGLRARTGSTHRRLGLGYTLAVAISAPCAMFMAFHAYPGTIPGGQWIVTSGFFTLALVWLATLVLAVHAITVRHDVAAHRFWMIVSFSLTFVAVVLRVENGILLATGTFETLYPFLAWIAWIPNLVIAMLLARRLNRSRVNRGSSSSASLTLVNEQRA
jgi:hypothetical protein